MPAGTVEVEEKWWVQYQQTSFGQFKFKHKTLSPYFPQSVI